MRRVALIIIALALIGCTDWKLNNTRVNTDRPAAKEEQGIPIWKWQYLYGSNVGVGLP